MAYSNITNNKQDNSTVNAGYNFVFDVLRFNTGIAALSTKEITTILSTSYALLRGSVKNDQLGTAIRRAKKELV